MTRPTHPAIGRTLGSIATAATLALLAGCANMDTLPPGTPLTQIEAKYGAPTFTCNLPDGRKRAVWSQNPLGQYGWGTNISADGRSDRIVPILTDENFEKLAQGNWTPAQVMCEFGPPEHIDRVGLGEKNEVVWSYRYRQQNVFNSLMYVYLGPNGDHVTHFHPGPDPTYFRAGVM